MERLTSDKHVSQMNMVELAYNSCYSQNGNACYRDYDMDIDVRKLAIDLLDCYTNTSNKFTDDEDFDEYMLDCLQYGIGDIKGLIALLYRNIWAMADLRGRLKEYEDLEEQGLILRLPCKVGDIVYTNAIEKNFITKCEVCRIEFVKYSHFGKVRYYVEPTTCRGTVYKFYDDDFSKCLFFSEEQAEQALMKMESEVK